MRALLRAAEPTGCWLPPLGALCRRAELMLLGQAQAPGWLAARGFRLPLGQAAWDELAAALRGPVLRPRPPRGPGDTRGDAHRSSR